MSARQRVNPVFTALLGIWAGFNLNMPEAGWPYFLYAFGVLASLALAVGVVVHGLSAPADARRFVIHAVGLAIAFLVALSSFSLRQLLGLPFYLNLDFSHLALLIVIMLFWVAADEVFRWYEKRGRLQNASNN